MNNKRFIAQYPLKRVTKFLNPKMLFYKHLGIKGDLEELKNNNDKRFMEIYSSVTALLKEAEPKSLYNPVALYGLYTPEKHGDSLIVKENGKEYVFEFPRQPHSDRLCITDFVEGATPFFVCTVGKRFLDYSKELTIKGQYVKSHLVNVLGMSLTEATAECLHMDLRDKLGLDKGQALTSKKIFAQKYTGKRFSFGYGSCPDLKMQKVLFDLLDPALINVTLTEGLMMKPEASISGIICNSKNARHFDIDEE